MCSLLLWVWLKINNWMHTRCSYMYTCTISRAKWEGCYIMVHVTYMYTIHVLYYVQFIYCIYMYALVYNFFFSMEVTLKMTLYFHYLHHYYIHQLSLMMMYHQILVVIALAISPLLVLQRKLEDNWLLPIFSLRQSLAH